MAATESKRLIADYIGARDAYHRAVEEGRREYDELVKADLITADDRKSEK